VIFKKVKLSLIIEDILCRSANYKSSHYILFLVASCHFTCKIKILLIQDSYLSFSSNLASSYSFINFFTINSIVSILFENSIEGPAHHIVL